MKARRAADVKKFTDIPNVGPAMVKDFLMLGIKEPKGLKGKDAFVLYKNLCKKTGTRHDPCVLDVFMAVIDFMSGGMPRDWWYYTKERKKLHPKV